MTDFRILGLTKSDALRVALLGAFTALAVVACGGDGGGTDTTGSGGTTSTGGGSSSTGGSSSSSGGSSSSTGGSSSSSGGSSSSTGGTADGGLGGEGGAGPGGNDDQCPATMPVADAECTVTGFPRPTCTYGDQECTCQGFQTSTWSCGEAVAPVECPTEQPVDGEACTPGAGVCQMCFCAQDQWTCF